MRHRKILLVIGLLTGIVVLFIQCIAKNAGSDPRGKEYAGSKACVTCHKDISESFAHTNHFKTSSKASTDELKKNVNPGNSVAYYGDSGFVKLEEKDGHFYQTYIKEGEAGRSEPLELGFGSGSRAQTYAYWHNGQLFQLPLTYLASLQTWTNSPGYPSQQPYFDRVILSRCLECHTSFVVKSDIQTGPLEVSEKMEASTVIFGIDCERCHGPAAQHVKFQEENPGVRAPKFITRIRSLSRTQQLDLCASCHSGNDLDVQRSMFAFRPGDTLDKFYLPHFGRGKEPDVHGKQMQLLRMSKCFQLTNMTCTTCHSSHSFEGDQQALFISKCMDCHTQSLHATEMRTAGRNCINCHMPEQASNSLNFNNGKERKSIPYLLRTHRIAVYPDTGR